MINCKKNRMAANISILTVIVSSYAGGVYAAMDSTSVLDFTASEAAGFIEPAIGDGSWFAMEALGPGAWIYTPSGSISFDGLTIVEGIKLGAVQTPAGSHTGAPDGTESPTVDNPWFFFASTGMHGTVGTAITVASDDLAGNVTLDMTGWRVDWNGVVINMGTGAAAIVSCANTCEFGDTYTLDYAAIVPDDGTTNFGNVSYKIHYEGTISEPPAFNSAPVAVQDDVEVDRKATGRAYTAPVIDIVANDTDADGNSDIDRTTVTVDPNGTDTTSGTVFVDPDTGNITYTPVDDFLGVDSFTYKVTDLGGPPAAPEGPLDSNVATVNITVQNAVPVAVDDLNISVLMNSSVLIGVASNDTDSDGTIDALSARITSPAEDGLAVVEASGLVTYTPNTDYTGPDSFTYKISDDDGAESTNEATVTISVIDPSIAGLPDGAFLIINAGNGTPGEGSLFSMEVNPGFLTYTGITGFNHIQIGTTQLGSAAMPGIDEPWVFFGNLGVHQSTSDITELADDGAGNVTLNFSGWDVSWNNIPSIPLGEGQDKGIATLTCTTTCAVGEAFTLIYHATVPDEDPSGFGNVKYILELDGVVSDVAPFLGGDKDGVLFDVTEVSAVDDSTAAISLPVSIGPGSVAVAAGNTTGVHLTAAEIGSKDPLLNDTDGTQCQGGCMDLIATGVTSDFIDVVFTLIAPIQEGGIYRKLINGKWRGYDTTSGDQLGSADADSSGNCQGPEGIFRIGLRTGAQCVFMRIFDGGPNDADGEKNGTIMDPSGVLVAGSPNTPAGSTNGCSISSTPVALRDRADWILIAIFLSIMGLVKFRRKYNV